TIRLLTRTLDQREMPLVKEPHGGDEPDAFPRQATGAGPGARLLLGPTQAHGRKKLEAGSWELDLSTSGLRSELHPDACAHWKVCSSAGYSPPSTAAT